MQQSTTLSNTMELAKEKAYYDREAKKLLSEKILLAWIMRECMSEYKDFSVEDIMTKCIIGVPQISRIPVERDVPSRIINTETEDTSISEGTITQDIRYNAIVPTTDGIIQLIINLEAQNDYYPGYPLVTRGIYYGSRMISGQSETVFFDSHYEKIQKVYSVWICTNPPKKHQNTITSYRITEENIVGDVTEKEVHYDLMNIMMICLGESNDVDSKILKLLDILLKDVSSVDIKKQQLSEEFDIPMTQEMESGVRIMCNLSDGIEQRGIEIGIEQGIIVSQVRMIRKQLGKEYELDEIADLLDIDLSFIQFVKVLLEEKTDATDDELAKEIMLTTKTNSN